MKILSFFHHEKNLHLLGAVFLTMVFFMGGGSRGDIMSLSLLRPLGFILLIVFLLKFDTDQFQRNRIAFLILLGLVLTIAIQLIPLPPSLWQMLPSRDWMVELAGGLQLGDQWYPVSFVPNYSYNSLFALVVPLVVLLAASRLNREANVRLVQLLFLFGLLSVSLGFLQIQTPDRTSFYLYRITNLGSFVGSFANRNHQALFLAIILTALPIFIQTSRFLNKNETAKPVVILAFVLVLFGSILLTGSRVGVVLALVALGYVAYALMQSNEFAGLRKWSMQGKLVLASAVLLLLAALLWFVLGYQANAISRILSGGSLSDLRFQYNPTVWKMIWDYFPSGIGFGNFPYVFAMHEPDELLNLTYLNHAHNDLFEFLLEGGVLSAGLLIAGIWFWISRSFKILNMRIGLNRRFAEVGSIMIMLMAISSVFDYPVRTPMIASMLMIAAVWLGYANRAMKD
jgi:O-antigen ligase